MHIDHGRYWSANGELLKNWHVAPFINFVQQSRDNAFHCISNFAVTGKSCCALRCRCCLNIDFSQFNLFAEAVSFGKNVSFTVHTVKHILEEHCAIKT